MDPHTDHFCEVSVRRKFEFIDKISHSKSAVVWRVTDKQSRIQVALKKKYDTYDTRHRSRQFFREIKALEELGEHPNIVKLRNVLLTNMVGNVYLVFELFPTDLFTILNYRERTGEEILESKHVPYIIYQITCALKFVHSAGLVHGDIKPSSVLINKGCYVKLCSFGSCRPATNGYMKGGGNLFDQYFGHRWFRAPEQLVAGSIVANTDMFSLALVLCEILQELGKPFIFRGKSTLDQLCKIVEVTGLPEQEDLDSLCSPHIATAMSHIKGIEPRAISEMFERANGEALDLLRCLLVFNPTKRISSARALQHPYFSEYHNEELEAELDEPVQIPLESEQPASIKAYQELITKNATERLRIVQKSQHE